MKTSVTYSKGRTINLGNFESTRVDIGITMECETEDAADTFERAKVWVNARLAKENGK